MKKFISIIMAIMLATTFMAFTSGCSNSKTKIAILQFAINPSLDNCYNGIKDGLKEKGFTDVEFDFQNAKAIESDNSEFAKSLINGVPDVAVGIATPSAYALAAAAQDTGIPVVFTAVSEPTKSGFTEFSNVTGSSDKLPVASQIDLIRSFVGGNETIRIGIIYTLSESNSVAQIEEFKTYETSKNIKIEAVGVNDGTEIATAIDSIKDKVDCFNNLTDNTVVQNLQVLLDKANAGNKPVFGSEVEQVKNGCLASCSLDYYKLGIQTGYMIADILNGKKADDIEYLYVNDDYTVDYNSEVLSTLKMTLPTSLTANDVIASK